MKCILLERWTKPQASLGETRLRGVHAGIDQRCQIVGVLFHDARRLLAARNSFCRKFLLHKLTHRLIAPKQTNALE